MITILQMYFNQIEIISTFTSVSKPSHVSLLTKYRSRDTVFLKYSLYKGYVYIINMSDSQDFQTNTGFVCSQNLVIFLGAIFIKPVFFLNQSIDSTI